MDIFIFNTKFFYFLDQLFHFGISWGKIELSQAATLSVTGEAKADKTSNTASFYATVSVTNDDKQKAIDEVNTKMEQLIKKVKEFGIEDKDIQTQNVGVYETS
ncbi:SIMPL domain-containing protein, partial [Candidatus Microgenomates bacterium]|nr:SIMPL domain-containing protein [Candidatus Microgenomates bacterium]